MAETIVLGIDGATWDVINPLVEAGELPNIGALAEEGYTGRLESTMPPITAPAWLSMATGQNPGKTGVYYFRNREDPDSFDLSPVDATDFRGKSFWDVLNGAGLSTGVFNFPMLHPPYDIEGFMVGGFGSPSDGTIAAPESLGDELDEVTGGYEVKVPYADPKYKGRPDALLEDLERVLDKRARAITYLLREKDPDVFFSVVSVTDWAQHYFWRYFDPEHVLHEPGYEDAIPRIFRQVDDLVGEVAEFATAEDANLALVSDHGFGPVNGTFYSNEWLASEGFRVEEEMSPVGKLTSEYFPYLRRLAEPIVSGVPFLNDLATSLGRSVRASPLDTVDRERSVAFASEQGYTAGLVYLLSDDPEDRTAVVEALRAFGREEDLSLMIHDPSELYHGPKTDLAPDILFEVEGLEYAVDPRFSGLEDVLVDEPPEAARGGGHRREGIYLFSGPDIEPGTGDVESLLAVAPTILALQSLPVPEEMDDSPIDGVVPDADVERAPLADLADAAGSSRAADDEAVREQLEDLGYI